MSQTYISPSNTFSFEYPDDWKMERIEGGTITLRKKGGLFKKDSLNVLSIMPQVSDEIISPAAYSAILNIRKKEHSDLEIVEKSDQFIMNFHILKYRKEVYQDIDKRTILMVQDYWELIISNRIFTCWFTAPQSEIDSPKAKEEKEISETVLHSLRLL